MDALKGVGWGLKTLGKYYPDLMIDWLPRQIHHNHRGVVVRKAITYLPAGMKEEIFKGPKG